MKENLHPRWLGFLGGMDMLLGLVCFVLVACNQALTVIKLEGEEIRSALWYGGLFLAAFVGMAFVLQSLLRHVPGKWCCYVWFFGAAVVGIALTSYIPCHDSLDTQNMLNALLQGKPLNTYETGYLNFYATNKLTLLFYYILLQPFPDLTLGIRIINGSCLILSLLCLSRTALHLWGERFERMALLLLPLLAPYLLLTGPYIYLPSILLSTAILALFTSGKRGWRVVSFVGMGVLLALRPTALAPVLVYVFLHYVGCWSSLKQLGKRLGILLVGLVVAVAVSKGVGAACYLTGLHVYPDLNSGAGLWTLEVGTRPSGDRSSGSCFYIPQTVPERLQGDAVAENLQRLWTYYEANDPDDLAAINDLKSTISHQLALRVYTAMRDTPEKVWRTLGYKTAKLFGNNYKPYYVVINVESDTFASDLVRNPDELYFFYENLLLGLFLVSAMGAVLLLRSTGRRAQSADGVYLMLSVFATLVVFLLLTEVSKKYTMDCFPEMVLAGIYGIGVLGERMDAERKKHGRLVSAAGITVTAVLAVMLLGCYSRNTMDCFRNMTYEIETVSETQRILHMHLDPAHTGEAYSLTAADGTTYDLLYAESVDIPYEIGKLQAFYVTTPRGKTYFISSQKIS